MEIKANILVVDDNEELSDGIKEFLEHEEYAVECANCGKDAIALVQDNKYDVALVDIEMPDMSGSELVKKLSSISSSMRCRIFSIITKSLFGISLCIKREFSARKTGSCSP